MTRHRFDVLSFGFGLGFVVIGLVLVAGDAVRSRELVPIAGPLAAILLGVILVAAARPRSVPEGGEAADAEIEDAAAS